MTSQIKTVLLLGLLSGIIIAMGGLLGGRTGVVFAFGLALLMNVGSYWYSDKIVLSMYRARELAPEEAPALHSMVEELARNAGIPKPRICVVPEAGPNAFATGRNPEHAVVAVTEGIMRLLSPEELRGVLGHEMGHIKNRDILIQTIAGVMASAIVTLANIFQFTAIFGGNREGEGGANPLAALMMALLAPLAAGLIQMAISRSREYLADDTGAALCGQPLALAGALAAGPGLLRRNFANLRLALPVALIASACAIVGAMLGLALPTNVVQTCLGATILGIAVLLLMSKNSVRPVVTKQDAVGLALGMNGVFLEPSTGEVVEWKTHRTLVGLLLFIAIGIMAGMFGLGAGWANVPVLNLLMGVPLKVGVGTSKFLLSITDTSAAWVYLNQGCVIPLMAVPSIVGLMLGSVVGVRLLAVAKPKFIRYMVIIVLFFSGAKALLKGLGW